MHIYALNIGLPTDRAGTDKDIMCHAPMRTEGNIKKTILPMHLRHAQTAQRKNETFSPQLQLMKAGPG